MAPDLRQLVSLYAAHRFTCHSDTVQTYSCDGKLLWSCKDEHAHFVQVELECTQVGLGCTAKSRCSFAVCSGPADMACSCPCQTLQRQQGSLGHSHDS